MIESLTGEAVFVFRDLAKNPNVLSAAQYAEFSEWVENAEKARQGASMSPGDRQANQYDKAEELITWNTFAPLLKLGTRVKDALIADIVSMGLQKDAAEYLDEWGFNVQFEKTLPPPPSYLNHLRSTVANHPVRYLRLDAEGKEILEGETHADIVFENSRLLVLGEVKSARTSKSHLRPVHHDEKICIFVVCPIQESSYRWMENSMVTDSCTID